VINSDYYFFFALFPPRWNLNIYFHFKTWKEANFVQFHEKV